MAKFNTATLNKTKTTNLAGGEAYKQSAELELASILLTSFVEDQYYRGTSSTVERIRELLKEVDPIFAAKAAIYARDQFGMRSISHVLAGELAVYASGLPWSKDFYNSVVVRPDDMTEIMAYFKSISGKNLTKAMQKGFSGAFGKFDMYQLAKYQGKNKEFSLIDVANLVHPVPTEKNAEALKALVADELKSFDTWESKLTQAGQKADTDEEKAELKNQAWTELIRTKKIGYFALLRNLRNIMEQAPEVLDEALNLLVDEKLIKKSRVLPFRYLTAYGEISNVDFDGKQKVMNALNKAIDISTSNVPKFDGKTLIALDTSSSMGGYEYSYGWASTGTNRKLNPKAPATIGAVLMAALAKGNPDNTDLMTFERDASYLKLDTSDSTLSLTTQIINHVSGGSTNTPAIFQRANKKYDRVIIISDMQTWVDSGYGSGVTPAYNDYKSKFGDLNVYTMDMSGYGTTNLSQDKIYQLAGFSEKIFDLMAKLEVDRNALVNEIKKVVL